MKLPEYSAFIQILMKSSLAGKEGEMNAMRCLNSVQAQIWRMTSPGNKKKQEIIFHTFFL
jgi:hypothetical protein